MKTLRPIKPNQGIVAKYNSNFQDILLQMCSDYAVDFTSIFLNNPSQNITNTPNSFEAIDDKSKKKRAEWDWLIWLFILNYATYFVVKLCSSAERSLKNALDEAGISVKFTETEASRQMIKALITENSNLITSLTSQYQDKVNETILRGYTLNKSADEIKDEIEALQKSVLARGKLIAKDQSNKINNAIQRVRLTELGITRVVWDHGSAFRFEPRESHIHATGTVFNLLDGCLIDGEYIQPGELIGCKCVYRAVLPF